VGVLDGLEERVEAPDGLEGVGVVQRDAADGVDLDERAMPLGDDSRVWTRIARGSNVQNAAALVALLLLVGTLAVTGAAPSQGEDYTEFYLLSENAKAPSRPRSSRRRSPRGRARRCTSASRTTNTSRSPTRW
jgi:hypothetical protein